VSKRWYVVHAYSGFEHQVQRNLLSRIERAGMQDKFGQVLVPTEEVVEMRAGQKRKSDRKFFPGYVLVQIETSGEGPVPLIDNESWHLIKETPKVLGFIGGTRERPLPTKDSEPMSSCSACRTASTSRVPKCCSNRVSWFVSLKVRSTISTALSKRSITRRAACA